MQKLVDEFADRRAKMLARIEKIDGVSAVEPYGAFYVMLVIGDLYGKSYKGKKIDGEMLSAWNAMVAG